VRAAPTDRPATPWTHRGLPRVGERPSPPTLLPGQRRHDGNKFKAVNNRDKNFTRAKVERRRAQLEESVARYLSQLDTADRQEPTEALAAKVTRLPRS
jgi:hypothetical protein